MYTVLENRNNRRVTNVEQLIQSRDEELIASAKVLGISITAIGIMTATPALFQASLATAALIVKKFDDDYEQGVLGDKATALYEYIRERYINYQVSHGVDAGYGQLIEETVKTNETNRQAWTAQYNRLYEAKKTAPAGHIADTYVIFPIDDATPVREVNIARIFKVAVEDVFQHPKTGEFSIKLSNGKTYPFPSFFENAKKANEILKHDRALEGGREVTGYNTTGEKLERIAKGLSNSLRYGVETGVMPTPQIDSSLIKLDGNGSVPSYEKEYLLTRKAIKLTEIKLKNGQLYAMVGDRPPLLIPLSCFLTESQRQTLNNLEIKDLYGDITFSRLFGEGFFREQDFYYNVQFPNSPLTNKGRQK